MDDRGRSLITGDQCVTRLQILGAGAVMIDLRHGDMRDELPTLEAEAAD